MTTQSQQMIWQGNERELPISSKQQPGILPRSQRTGIEARTAASVLAALTFIFVICYAVAYASVIRNGYVEMELRREIEELRADIGLLRYQINLTESSARAHEFAAMLEMVPGTAIGDTDYIAIPATPIRSEAVAIATGNVSDKQGSLTELFAEVRSGVLRPVGRAEASMVVGHRR